MSHKTANTMIKPAPEAAPLEELSRLLSNDMAETNKLIIERMQSEIPLIPQLAGYLIAAGGKRIRPLMTLASTRLFDESTTRAYRLAAAVEFIHTATLLHDDVVDESDQRRGQSSANAVFGNQSSVLVGDFLFSKSFELMVEDGSIDVLGILSKASAVIAEGEVLQLSIQNSLETTLAQYERVISAKTAALFAAACEVGAVITDQPQSIRQALHDYGHHVGMAFQIADDILDYQSSTEELGKSIGDDFKEGKMTAPVIFALQAADSEQTSFWTRTLGNQDISDEDLKHAQSLIRSTGADQKTIELARNHIRLAQSALQDIPDSAIKSLFLSLADYTLNRKN